MMMKSKRLIGSLENGMRKKEIKNSTGTFMRDVMTERSLKMKTKSKRKRLLDPDQHRMKDLPNMRAKSSSSLVRELNRSTISRSTINTSPISRSPLSSPLQDSQLLSCSLVRELSKRKAKNPSPLRMVKSALPVRKIRTMSTRPFPE